MKKHLKLACLPNGQEVFCLQVEEAKVLYKQVQEYLKYGICIQEGDVVFDVGANIGLFSLMVNNLGAGKVKILAFEPIPNIFEALKLNANKFNPNEIDVFQIGLGKQTQNIEFIHYPNATAISSMYPDQSGLEKQQFATTITKNLEQLPNPINLIRFLPQPLLSFCADRLVDFAYLEQKIECKIKTISQVINEQSIKQIDLMKIDVEKAELDVLEGIIPEDWSKIQQVVIEVHNIDCRVQRIINLLTEQGFSHIERQQDPIFKYLDIHSVYAKR